MNIRLKSVGFCISAIILSVAATGCSSRKSAVRGSDGYSRSETRRGSSEPVRHTDYSYEVPDALGLELAAEARRWLGTPYVYGGQDMNGTDCSGLVMQVYNNVCLLKLPRTTVTQKEFCREVGRNKARVGDLMFFGHKSNGGSDITHVGLYIGKGEMIHASSSRGVMVSSVDEGYWGQRFRGVGRVGGAQEAWQKRGKKSRGNVPVETPSTVPADFPMPEEPLIAVGNSQTTVPNSVDATVSHIDLRPLSAVSSGTATASAPEAASTIDLLDLIINQKVDSIFSNQFMD